MCNYLHGPRQGGMYYFRMGVPEHLRPIVGKREFFFSLRTKDHATAKRLILQVEAPRHSALLDAAEAEFARQRATGTPVNPEEAARRRNADKWHRAHMDAQEEAEAERERSGWEQEARHERDAPIREALLARISGSTARMKPEDAVVARHVREIEEAAREREEELRQQLCHLQTDGLSGVAQDSHRGSGASTHAHLPKSSIGAVRGSRGNSAAVTITGLFDLYGAQDGIAPGTVKQWRNYINHLVGFLGHDDAKRVTTHDLIGWREKLRTEVSKRGKGLSSKTINGSYMAAANVTFGYGLNQLLLSHNPMLGVGKVRADKKPKLRERDFSKTEREAILAAALTPPKGRLSEHRKLARRWVPWLCAYSGARVNEITQLRAGDVAEIDGVWTIRITPEAGTVKTNAARIVPLHEHLIEQGFLSLVKGREGPLFYDPSDARAKRGGQHKKVGMFLANWVRQDVRVTDPDVAPNHGWRHTFKTICREAEIDESAADYMQGHAHKGQGRRYGSNTIPALAKQLAKFPRYPVR